MPGEHLARLAQMRDVQHLAVEADGASLGVGVEGSHHAARVLHSRL